MMKILSDRGNIFISYVLVIPHDGRRKLREFKGTCYFGEKHQRKTNGHCKIYNKQLELLENQGKVIDHELTRIENVYNPEYRISLAEILHHPPEQNKQYFAAVTMDWDSLLLIQKKWCLSILNN